ncbi:MAG: patatin-like phospholipase family protein [Firmicutes bacterium]|nr:patatin-like phospholipase family protein [Bacillota bacterium]
MRKKMKRALVLEGGGAKGAYQVGAYQALREAGFDFDGFIGVSIGSLNGVMFAQDRADLCRELWLSLDLSEIFGLDQEKLNRLYEEDDFMEKISAGADLMKVLMDHRGLPVEPMMEIFRKYVDEEALRQSDKEFGLVTLNASKKKGMELFLEDIPQGKLTEFLMASCYLPVFEMKPIMGDYYLDGGFYDRLPIAMVRDLAEEIVAIGLNPEKIRYMGTEIGDDVLFIQPSQNLGKSLAFSPVNAQRNMDLGFEDTRAFLQKEKALK